MDNTNGLKPFSSLAIGSVPYSDPQEALDLLALLDIPAAPQMVKVSFYEDMIFGALDGFPFVKVQEAEKKVLIEDDLLADNLAQFYESFYAGDYAFLALSPKSSLGLEPFLARAKATPAFGEDYLKAQVVGPLTLAQSIKLTNGTAALDQPDVLEALSLGLGAKAAYLAGLIRATGRSAVVFIDEPGLTGYGSAFSTLSAETILKSLGQATETARSQGPVYLGCHVCGNTDWGLLSQAGLDILNFDAFSHLEPFSLYPRELAAFLAKGGYIAFGLVPTEDYSPDLTAETLLNRLDEGLKPLKRHIDPDLLKARTLFSTSCGLGSLPPTTAGAIFKLLADVSRRARGE